jgi:cytochrome c oxidase cbb3-type subunit 3
MFTKTVALWSAVMCGALCLAAGARGQSTSATVDPDTRKPLTRGGIAFKNYCALCHGERGDGVARAAKLYRGLHLKIRTHAPAYYQKIIQGGGTAVGASPFMPPWQDELSTEQVADILAYLDVATNPARRGEVVFKTNCILCHGERADGNGRAAALFNPRPANLRQSTKTADYKRKIIQRGGEAMGRSSVMPAWREKLTDTEIADLLAYLQTILDAPTAAK